MTQPVRARLTQKGLSIVELMVSMVLATLVVLLATAFFLSSRNVYTAQDESSKMNDVGNFAAQTITRLIRQAAFIPRTNSGLATLAYNPEQLPVWQNALVFGTNNSVMRWNGSTSTAINNSDSLTTRFWGSGGPSGNADGTIVDCLGQEIPPPGGGVNVVVSQAQMTVYLSLDVNNEPQLVCSALSFGATATEIIQPIARGIERLQFLYGLDTSTPRDNLPDVFLSADEVTTKGLWNRVIAVQYAFLVRSGLNARTEPDKTTTYALFGPGYKVGDAGTTLQASTLSAQEQTRLRRVYSGVVHVRQGVEGNNL